MSGVEIKPGVWINTGQISEIKVEFCKKEYETASFRRWKFERDRAEMQTKMDLFQTYDPEMVEGLKNLIALGEQENPKVTFDDFKKVVVWMDNGNRHVLETGLQETLRIVGWANGEN